MMLGSSVRLIAWKSESVRRSRFKTDVPVDQVQQVQFRLMPAGVADDRQHRAGVHEIAEAGREKRQDAAVRLGHSFQNIM